MKAKIKVRGKRFFEQLTPLASALNMAISTNSIKATNQNKSATNLDDYAAKVEKQNAKLARRAARAKGCVA